MVELQSRWVKLVSILTALSLVRAVAAANSAAALLEPSCVFRLAGIYPCYQKPIDSALCCPALAEAVQALCFCDPLAWGLAGYFGLNTTAVRSLYLDACALPAPNFYAEGSAKCTAAYGYTTAQPGTVPAASSAGQGSKGLSLGAMVGIAVAVGVGNFGVLVGIVAGCLVLHYRCGHLQSKQGPPCKGCCSGPQVGHANPSVGSSDLEKGGHSSPDQSRRLQPPTRPGRVSISEVLSPKSPQNLAPDHRQPTLQPSTSNLSNLQSSRSSLSNLQAKVGNVSNRAVDHLGPLPLLIPNSENLSQPLSSPSLPSRRSGRAYSDESCASLVAHSGQQISGQLFTPQTSGPLAPTRGPSWLVKYPLEELVLATDNFTKRCPMLGPRAHVGKLHGDDVAVIRLPPEFSLSKENGEEATDEEIAALLRPVSRIRHARIQPLKGYCVCDGRLLLIYAFSASPGVATLADCLFAPQGPLLSWLHRVALAESVALCLLHLHQDMQLPVASGRVEPLAILVQGTEGLSEDCIPCPLLTGVGLDSLVDLRGQVSAQRSPTIDSDVHAYGVLLFELVCGHPVEGEVFLGVLEKVQPLLEDKPLPEGLVDPRLGGQFLLQEVGRLLMLALKCVSIDEKLRPSMREVVATLQNGMPSLDKVAAIVSGFRMRSGPLGVEGTSDDPPTDPHLVWASSEDTPPESDYTAPFLTLQRSSTVLQMTASDEMKQYDLWVTNGELLLSQIELGECVGGGAFGQIFKAWWCGAEVAVKVVKDLVTKRGSEDLMGVWREVAILQRLRHPNVVLYMGAVAREPNEVWIVMEYLVRGSLYSIIHVHRKQLSLLRRLKMIKDVACGMNYLHNQGIVHRDLKSQNVLVTPHAALKVCDFGQSRLRKGSSSSTARLAGTAPYMAPEAFRGAECSFKSDVYSFAIVLWEVLSGRKPWDGLSELQILYCVLHEGQRPVLQDDWDAAVCDLVRRCWAEDPDARPSFEEIVHELTAMVGAMDRKRREELEELRRREALEKGHLLS